MGDPILHKHIRLLAKQLKDMHTNKKPSTFEIARMLDGSIKKFSGDGDMPFISWLQEYTDTLTRFNVDTERGKTLLPQYLTDGARVQYETIENPDTKDWKTLTTELATLLKDGFVIENAKDDLHYITQGADTVGRYADRIKKKCKVAFQGQGNAVIEKEMIDYFIRGLRADIKAHMRRLPAKPQKFQEALALAEREAKTIDQQKLEEMNRLMETPATVNAFSLVERIEALENQRKELENQCSYDYNRSFQHGDNNYWDEENFDDGNEHGLFTQEACYDEETDDNWTYDNGNENYWNERNFNDGCGHGKYDEDGWYEEDGDWNDDNFGDYNNFEAEDDGWYPPNGQY